MRSAFIGLGLFVAVGLLITFEVHGQVIPSTSENSNRYASWNTTGGNDRSEPVLLADAADPFSVTRKAQDMNFGAPSQSSSSGTANTMAPPFGAAQSNGQPDSAAAPYALQQPSSGTQSIFSNGTTNSNQDSATAKSRAAGDSSDSMISPLRSLQQRLSAVRKSPTAGATPAAELHPPVVEMPNASTAAPVFNAPVVTAPVVAGPLTAPASAKKVAALDASSPPPNMPDLRSTSLSPKADRPVPDTMTIKSGDAVASVPVMPRTPVVGEPINAVRRPPSTATSTTTDTDAVSSQEDTPRASTFTKPIAIPNDNVLFSEQSPVLAVETTGPRSISVGKEATYNVSISNTGEMAAQNVTVSIKTPEWSEILGTKVTTGETLAASEHRGEPLLWRLPRLESHSKEQLSIRLVARESRPFDLAVQWACAPATLQAMVEVKEPKIALALDGPSEILYGQTKLYKLTLSNPGTGDAENVELLLAPVDGGPGAPTRQEIGLIRAGETKPVEVELSARQAGKLSVKAMAVADGNLHAEVAEEVLVRRAGLKASLTGPEIKFAGTPASYNVVVANPGNATSENISVSAVLPPGAKYVSSPGGQFVESENKIVWSLPSLRAGAEQELQFSCALNAPGANRLQVLTTATNDLYDNAAATTNVEALADLKLEVSDPPGPLAVGDEMSYEVHIRNRGTKAAENVDVAGFFSNGIEPIAAQGGQNEISPGQVVFQPIASISAGSEVVLKITARADQPGNHVFRVEVNCPSMGSKLASEETTLFYGDGKTPTEQRIAARPNPAAPGSPISPTENSAPAVPR
ncbi:MAG TPA: hypothetical protein VMJ32_18385 [Pirellulales bacterium]|nr:hypothetical protein [Pirellulales bacterium]